MKKLREADSLLTHCRNCLNVYVLNNECTVHYVLYIYVVIGQLVCTVTPQRVPLLKVLYSHNQRESNVVCVVVAIATVIIIIILPWMLT